MNAAVTPGFERRKSDGLLDDAADEEILRLLRDATDPTDKAMLTVLFAIRRDAWKTSHTVEEVVKKIDAQDRMAEQHREKLIEMIAAHKQEYEAHRKEFLQHAANEEKLMSSGQAAWRVLSVVGIAVISLGTYIMNGHLSDMRSIQDMNTAQEKVLNTQDKEFNMLRNEVRNLSDAFSRHLVSQQEQARNGLRLPER